MVEDSWWIYHDDEVHGPFSVEELANINGLSGEHQVCPESEDEWRSLADEPELVEAIRARRNSAESTQQAQTSSDPEPPDKTGKTEATPDQMESSASVQEEETEDNWYFKMPDGKSDPFTLEELRTLPALTPDMEVRREDQDEWTPVEEIPELADALDSEPSGSRSDASSESTIGPVRWGLLITLVILLTAYIYFQYLS